MEIAGSDLRQAWVTARRVLAEDGRPAVRCAALRALALVRREHGDAHTTRRLLRRAWSEARSAGETTEARLARDGVEGLLALHRPHEARPQLRTDAEARELLRDGVRRSQLGDLTAARHAFTCVLRLTSDPQVRVAALLGSGEAQLVTGALGDAAEQLEHALCLARDHSLHYLAALVQQNQGCLDTRRGSCAAALAAFDAATPLLTGARATALALDRAEALTQAGLDGQARSEVARDARPHPHADRVAALWLRVQAATRSGDPTTALHQARQLRQLSHHGRRVGEHVERQIRATANRGEPVSIPITGVRSPPPTAGSLLERYRRTWLSVHGGDDTPNPARSLRAELADLADELDSRYRAARRTPPTPREQGLCGPSTLRYTRKGEQV